MPDAEKDALLREALDLLRIARCEHADPGLRRSWGQRRRRWMDKAISVTSPDGGDR
jgi:hypothetical protein